MTTKTTIPPGQPLTLDALITPTEAGIASRVLARSAGGNVTLFAFDAKQELSAHTSPFDALLLVLEGAFDLTIGGDAVHAAGGSIVLLPANIPHAVHAREASRMLLIMLREMAAPSGSHIQDRRAETT